MKVTTAEQMQGLDRAAINDFGIPGIVLMENAGRGAVEAITREYGALAGKLVSIFAGPGNNGGDGLVIARHLHQQGARPHVFLLTEPEKLLGDAATNLVIVQKLSIPIHLILSQDDLNNLEDQLGRSRFVIDAIFGTGLTREVTGHFAEVIKRINMFSCPVVAVDIPSGLNSDNGQPLGQCVQADLTVTFGLAKVGLVVQPGARYVGKLEVVDIGIPQEAVQQIGVGMEVLDKQELVPWIPARQATDHKGTFGHLLILAGSAGKTGAAILSALGALRSGIGLVTLCVPHDLNAIFESSLLEAMTVPLPNSFQVLSVNDFELVARSMEGKEAVVVGPGLGTAQETAELVIKVYREAPQPLLVDADGLNILAQEQTVLQNPPAPRILTPHPGEMARLIGGTAKDVQASRHKVAAEFAREKGVFVVLKGANTVIASPEGRVAVNPTGNAGMATGGMGDVLSGLIGSLLAQGLSPWQAACLGVYVHGLAGDNLAAATGIGFGYLAGDLANELPLAFQEMAE